MKAGSGYSLAFDGHMASGIQMAEGVINTLTRFDWNSGLSAGTLGSPGIGILGDACSSLVAIDAIQFDMTGYPSRIIAEDMINVNRDIALRNLAILRDKKNQDFLTNA